MNQLKQQQNQEKPSYDTKQIAALLQQIFQNVNQWIKHNSKHYTLRSLIVSIFVKTVIIKTVLRYTQTQ